MEDGNKLRISKNTTDTNIIKSLFLTDIKVLELCLPST